MNPWTKAIHMDRLIRTVVIALIALTANAVFEARQARSTPPDNENVCRELLDMGWWSDPIIQPEPILDYYREVISRSFGGDVEAARRQARLFMVPGMGHCGGGVGPQLGGSNGAARRLGGERQTS